MSDVERFLPEGLTVAATCPARAACRTFTSDLHFRPGQEFNDQLAAAGLTHVEIAGDSDHGPGTDASTVLVVRAIRN